jgi:hypothetical protein
MTWNGREHPRFSKNTPEQSARIVELGKAIEEQERAQALLNAAGVPKIFPRMIVRLMGGVGNQLFQYAFGISLAAKHGVEVGFTNWRCYKDKWRPAGYQLDAFVKDIQLCPQTAEVEPNIAESSFSHSSDLPKLGTFVGYWQSEKYFDVKLVREKVAYRYPLSEQSLKIAEEINSYGQSSSFLHIRRGADYQRSDFHAKQTLDYYDEAIQLIRDRYKDAMFFLFGDDPDWMRANFKGSSFVIVDHNKPDTNATHEDMHLMSLCHNGAIANSSFSWWAAWLGNNRPNQLIFSPRRWFGGDNQAGINMGDITPDRWVTI